MRYACVLVGLVIATGASGCGQKKRDAAGAELKTKLPEGCSVQVTGKLLMVNCSPDHFRGAEREKDMDVLFDGAIKTIKENCTTITEAGFTSIKLGGLSAGGEGKSLGDCNLEGEAVTLPAKAK